MRPQKRYADVRGLSPDPSNLVLGRSANPRVQEQYISYSSTKNLERLAMYLGLKIKRRPPRPRVTTIDVSSSAFSGI